MVQLSIMSILFVLLLNQLMSCIGVLLHSLSVSHHEVGLRRLWKLPWWEKPFYNCEMRNNSVMNCKWLVLDVGLIYLQQCPTFPTSKLLLLLTTFATNHFHNLLPYWPSLLLLRSIQSFVTTPLASSLQNMMKMWKDFGRFKILSRALELNHTMAHLILPPCSRSWTVGCIRCTIFHL